MSCDERICSREFVGCMREGNNDLCLIMENLIRECLELIAEIGGRRGGYKKFCVQFDKCLGLGVHEEYVDRMKVGQSDIFCIVGEGIAAVSSSPLLVCPRMKGSEVMYMVDLVDGCTVQQHREFDGEELKSTTKGELGADGEDGNSKIT